MAASRFYGLTVATCVPADPESKGGVEATVRIAKADVLPTDANLLPYYPDFASLEAACVTFCEGVNARPHRETATPPVELLAVERGRLHAVPATPYTAALGVTRRVTWSSTISFGGVRYSVPWKLAGGTVWVRVEGEELVASAMDPARGMGEVARHPLSTPGNPRICSEHYPPRPAGALERRPTGRPTRRRRRSWRWATVRGNGWSRPGRRAPHASPARWPRRWRCRSSTAPRRWTGRSGWRPSPPDSPTVTSSPSSPTSARATQPARSSGPTEAHSLQPGTASWEGFGR